MKNHRIAFLAFTILIFINNITICDIGFSGTAYNETSFIEQDNKIKYGNRSAMHFNATSLSKGVRFVSEIELYTLYGYLSSVNPQFSEAMKDGTFYIDRLYMKFPIKMIDITLGKQRIAWGTGYIYRPTDKFNKPNPLSLSGRKEGVNAILSKAYISDLSAIELVISPADTFKEIDSEVNQENLKFSKFAVRCTSNYLKSDIGLSYQYNGEEKEHIFGLSMKGDIKVGYHIETSFDSKKDGFKAESIGNYLDSVIGIDYSFLGKWMFLGEYFYNGHGINEKVELPKSNFSILEDFNYRHYLYFLGTYKHDIFLNVNISFIFNMVDESFIISPNLGYGLFQNTDLQIYSQIFGNKGEFGSERLGLKRAYYLRLVVKF